MSDTMEEVSRLNEWVDERRYGKYRAFVVDNEDPEKRGRLCLLIPSVLGDAETGWALPCFPFGGGESYGWFAVPEKDAQVWAEFEEGDINRPIWTGVFWQREADVPEEAAKSPPTTRIFQTPSGHIMQFDDEEDKESFRLFHPREAEIHIDENGTLVLKDASGASITLDAEGEKIIIEDANRNQLIMDSSGVSVEDANGNKIEMAASGITMKGQQIILKGTQVMLGGEGGEPVMKGTSFMTFFNTHTHGTALGPSTPPVVPMTPAQLSTKVTTT
ncbi:MAG: phage baseplate assembly protein V [Proteobacteria bacterium]|nr:phage baseplate assembly protein V [Cystobacterineae bacterium]MCL2314767.1 phage baseplate assembly protein V [Pseudomonadota bacterium]